MEQTSIAGEVVPEEVSYVSQPKSEAQRSGQTSDVRQQQPPWGTLLHVRTIRGCDE